MAGGKVFGFTREEKLLGEDEFKIGRGMKSLFT